MSGAVIERQEAVNTFTINYLISLKANKRFTETLGGITTACEQMETYTETGRVKTRPSQVAGGDGTWRVVVENGECEGS